MSKKFYEILKKTLENYENIEKKDIKGFSTQRHLMKKIWFYTKCDIVFKIVDKILIIFLFTTLFISFISIC